jgi:hypothetical protein
MDRPGLWRQVVDAAIASGVAPGGETDTARKLARDLDGPASDMVRTLAPPETFRAAGDLAARLAAVLQPTSPDTSVDMWPRSAPLAPAVGSPGRST